MRSLVSVVLLGVAVSSAAQAQTETAVPTTTTAPSMTAVQPVNPVASTPAGPVIQSITAHVPPGTGAGNSIVPEFHFIAPNGNAVLIHREVVQTNANHVNVNPSSAINIPADAQKQGAVVSGGWGCGTSQYYATMRAYIMDADGNRSNEVQYTIHCNGG